jgi:hypothetical protein
MKLKRELLFFCAIVLVGLLDWLTTVMGVCFFGAREINPLFSGLARSNMLFFSAVKLSAVTIAGFAFYKAAAISSLSGLHLSRRFLDGGYSLTVLAVTITVANNILIILKF